MALGKEMGDWKLKITSVSYAQENTAMVDCDGTADGFGTILGTLFFTVLQPGEKNGQLRWRGQAFPDGGVIQATGEGAFQELGGHKWRTRLVISTSDGQVFASDGVLDLASRSATGKNLEWS